MNTIKIALIAILLASATHAESYAYQINGHFKEVDLEFTPMNDRVQVYDSGTQTWSWVARTWKYPSARYGKSKKAVPASFPTMYYAKAWENGSIGCYCDTSYSYWTTVYYYDLTGAVRKTGYSTKVEEVQIAYAYQQLAIDYNSGPMAW
jgi:hypothetical protein